MKGYWLILGAEITDAEAQAHYGALWAPIAQKYGARLVKDAQSLSLKEGRNTARVLLVEFPSYAQAKACYDDPAYQQAKAFALAASSRDLLVFEGDVA